MSQIKCCRKQNVVANTILSQAKLYRRQNQLCPFLNTFLTPYLSWLYNKTIGEVEESLHISSSSSNSNSSDMNRKKVQRVQSERMKGSTNLKHAPSYKRINDHGKKIDDDKPGEKGEKTSGRAFEENSKQSFFVNSKHSRKQFKTVHTYTTQSNPITHITPNNIQKYSSENTNTTQNQIKTPSNITVCPYSKISLNPELEFSSIETCVYFLSLANKKTNS